MKKIDSIFVTVKVERPSSYIPNPIPYNMTARQYLDNQFSRMVEQSEKDILRHLDVELGDRQYNFVCEHCGSKWAEESSEYNGGCCEKDEQNNPDAGGE